MIAIYARQSVEKKDSISIESQIEYAKREVFSEDFKIYQDSGYSGKNTDRPEFQKLLGEIRKGKVRRVIVYKLDRISGCLPLRPYQPFHSGFCGFHQHFGIESNFLRFRYGKIRYLYPHGTCHAVYHRGIRPTGTGNHCGACAG